MRKRFLLPMISWTVRSKRKKWEGKSCEKENLFRWHWFTFCFGRNDELCSRTKNNPYEEQSTHPQRNLVGVDDL